ncbi:hypothetical protein ACKWTF_013184 [Chironomus riparius]|jgi:transcriptional adapter 2-beta
MSAELLFATYKCTNCQETISGVRVQCHEPSCQDVMLVLCLQCFASGAELGPHKNSHPYSFNDPNAITIFRGKGAFSALEELKLLKAVEHYGFGNWDDISKDIETRSPEEAKDEYISKFLNGTIGKHTWKFEKEQKLTLTDHTTVDDRSIDELQVEKFSESSMEVCTQEHAAQLGYMPYRDDFEREYDVTAEQLVSNLALTSDDDEIESALKLAVVDIYNRRLRERARKKRIARDYRLIQEFFRKFENGKGKGINQTKDERGLRLSLKNFRQFYSNDAFERLIYSLERERILRIRLTELCRYRWNGLTKIDECEHFEKHAAANHHRTSCPFGFGHYKQLACLSGANGCYVRHISAGAPKRSHFASRRQNGSSNHINEISAASIGSNGTAKKRRRRKGNKLKFHRPKIHAPHRLPQIMRRIIQQQKLLG